MYWNLFEILPYQRNFNFINGPREIGKTYTTLKWLFKQALSKKKSFVYLCRTQDEKKNNVLKFATDKVRSLEYPDIKFTGNEFQLFANHQLVASCIALSEHQKIKKLSFPSTKYLIFDEYMLENEQGRYVNGWKEPDIFLSIYQTIDRGEDSLKCFLLGNNTSFYNPYHLHPAFNIPPVKPGSIWTSPNVLFQWALPSPELQDKLNSLKFNKQVSNTNYGKFALHGEYLNDKTVFLENLSQHSKYRFTIIQNSEKFGVYFDNKSKHLIVSQKIQDSCPFILTLSPNDHSESSLLVSKTSPYLKWFSQYFKQGLVRFDSMNTKSKTMDWLLPIIK